MRGKGHLLILWIGTDRAQPTAHPTAQPTTAAHHRIISSLHRRQNPPSPLGTVRSPCKSQCGGHSGFSFFSPYRHLPLLHTSDKPIKRMAETVLIEEDVPLYDHWYGDPDSDRDSGYGNECDVARDVDYEDEEYDSFYEGGLHPDSTDTEEEHERYVRLARGKGTHICDLPLTQEEYGTFAPRGYDDPDSSESIDYGFGPVKKTPQFEVTIPLPKLKRSYFKEKVLPVVAGAAVGSIATFMALYSLGH